MHGTLLGTSPNRVAEKLPNFPFQFIHDWHEGTIRCLESTHLKWKSHSRAASGLGKQVRSYLYLNDTMSSTTLTTFLRKPLFPSDRTYILFQFPAYPAVNLLIFLKNISPQGKNCFSTSGALQYIIHFATLSFYWESILQLYAVQKDAEHSKLIQDRHCIFLYIRTYLCFWIHNRMGMSLAMWRS